MSATQAGVKPNRVTIANQIRRLIALAAILSMAAIGVWVEKGMAGLEDRIMAALVTFGPAAIYLFGYFYWLPDVLGAPARKKGSLRNRWSSFAGISALITEGVWIAWLVAVMSDSSFWNSSSNNSKPVLLSYGLATLLAPLVLMLACVGASEKYLAETMSVESSEDDGNPPARSRVLIRRTGRVIARSLTTTRALSCGSALVLATLLLNMTLMSDCGRDPRKGHEIVTGKAVWVTAQQTEGDSTVMKRIVAGLGRGSYILALCLGAFIPLTCISGARGTRLRQNRTLVVITGCLGLYAICDFTFGWARVLSLLQPLQVVVWLVAWIIPAPVWIIRTPQAERWDHTRLAIMVALLPVMFFTCTMGVYTALELEDLNGLGVYLVGILLLWWGVAQSAFRPASVNCWPANRRFRNGLDVGTDAYQSKALRC